MFACAVILFIWVSGHPPFNEASPKDPYYKALAMGSEDKFWKAHCKRKTKG